MADPGSHGLAVIIPSSSSVALAKNDFTQESSIRKSNRLLRLLDYTITVNPDPLRLQGNQQGGKRNH